MASDTLWQRLRGLIRPGSIRPDRIRPGWIKPDLGRVTAPPLRDTVGSTRVADSLRALLDDPTIPAALRSELAGDFARIEA
ncbi:MAG TPA: hypothetical protein VFE75_07080, partial [Rhodanobacter sp.]|nr:hypothetical protein [Rhodanobacter sp.]